MTPSSIKAVFCIECSTLYVQRCSSGIDVLCCSIAEGAEVGEEGLNAAASVHQTDFPQASNTKEHVIPTC